MTMIPQPHRRCSRTLRARIPFSVRHHVHQPFPGCKRRLRGPHAHSAGLNLSPSAAAEAARSSMSKTICALGRPVDLRGLFRRFDERPLR